MWRRRCSGRGRGQQCMTGNARPSGPSTWLAAGRGVWPLAIAPCAAGCVAGLPSCAGSHPLPRHWCPPCCCLSFLLYCISTLLEPSVCRWEISTFEYLMALNTLAGRTYNDLNQYPVRGPAMAREGSAGYRRTVPQRRSPDGLLQCLRAPMLASARLDSTATPGQPC